MTSTPGTHGLRITCSLVEWLEHGPYWVAIEFVERVALTDREPAALQVSHLGGTGYAWYRESGRRYLNAEPTCMSFLPDDVHANIPGDTIWKERAAAIAALSDALIAWAKQQPKA